MTTPLRGPDYVLGPAVPPAPVAVAAPQAADHSRLRRNLTSAGIVGAGLLLGLLVSVLPSLAGDDPAPAPTQPAVQPQQRAPYAQVPDGQLHRRRRGFPDGFPGGSLPGGSLPGADDDALPPGTVTG